MKRCTYSQACAWASTWGLISSLEIPAINKLFVHTQPAHLQKLSGIELDTSDRNIERATFLRQQLDINTGDNSAGDPSQN